MDDPLQQPEMARRIRAVMKYGRIDQRRAAQIVNVSYDHLSRYVAGTTSSVLEPHQLRALAAAAGIDPNFFTADLSRLSEIVPPGGTVFTPLDAPVPPGMPGELRRLPEDPQTSDETGGHGGPGPAGDAP